MFVIKVYVNQMFCETYVIPKPTLEDAKRYAYECAKKRCGCVIPNTYEEFEAECNDDDSWNYIDVLSDDAQLML